jgi:hypothetical protein
MLPISHISGGAESALIFNNIEKEISNYDANKNKKEVISSFYTNTHNENKYLNFFKFSFFKKIFFIIV